MFRLTTIVLAGLALLGVTSCSSYRVREHETLVSFAPRDDAILVLEIERGIQSESTGDASVAQAFEALRSALGGHRRFPAEGGLFSVDFDDALALESMDEARAAEFREFAASVRVEDSGLYLDEHGRLSFYRLTRFAHCGRLLEIVNAFICREASSPEEDAKPFTPAFPYFDEASWKLARAASDAGHRWLAIDGDSLVLDIPMTDTNAARCLKYLVAEEREAADAANSFFLAQITGVEVTGGHARLRFLGPAHPVLRFAGSDDDPSYDDAVERHVRERGLTLGGPDAPARARARMESGVDPRAK